MAQNIKYTGGYPVYGGPFGRNQLNYAQRMAAAQAGYSYAPHDPADSLPPAGDYTGGGRPTPDFSPTGPYRYGIDPSGPSFSDPFSPGFSYSTPGSANTTAPGGGGGPFVDVPTQVGGIGPNPFEGPTDFGLTGVATPTDPFEGAKAGGIGGNPFGGAVAGGESGNPFGGAVAGGQVTGGYNYYDAGGGVTYVYDANWNYLGTKTAPQSQQQQTQQQQQQQQKAGGSTSNPNSGIHSGGYGPGVAPGTHPSDIGGAGSSVTSIGASVGGEDWQTSSGTSALSGLDSGSGGYAHDTINRRSSLADYATYSEPLPSQGAPIGAWYKGMWISGGKSPQHA